MAGVTVKPPAEGGILQSKQLEPLVFAVITVGLLGLLGQTTVTSPPFLLERDRLANEMNLDYMNII